MTDWRGLHTEYYNSIYNNMPPYMRKKGPTQIIKIYDNYFQPVTSEFMPRAKAPAGESGKPVSPRTPFRVPITSDPQYMSDYAGFKDRPAKRIIAFRSELYSASMIQEDGPEWDPTEFDDEWNDEFLNFRNQFLEANAIRAMNRKIEYDNISYLYGQTWALNRFSPGISTARKKSLDASSSSEGLVGTPWSTGATADPLKDISRIKYFSREMNGRECKFGLIGNQTKYSLENNTSLKEALKYVIDYTNVSLGTTLAGIDLRYVGGLTSKGSTSIRPGQAVPGDVRETTWDSDNRNRFMTHVSGETTYEWGLFLPGIVGNTFMARTSPKHEDVTSPYVHSWYDEEHEIRKTRMRLAYTPFIDDWADVMVVTKLAARS